MIINFCYRKVERSITKWGATEKSPILRKMDILIWHQKLFRILGTPILFSPTVYISCQSCPLDSLFKQCESRKVTDWAENEYTVDENIIATVKMRNIFGTL